MMRTDAPYDLEHRNEPSSVLDRIMGILDAVKDATGPLSLTELAQRVGIPKSSAARLAGELVEQRYLERHDTGVVLGLRLFELGSRATLPQRLLAAAAPIIHRLWGQTGERVGLWVHRDGEMVSISAVPGRLPWLPTQAGMRSPMLTTASGKAYLAFCEPGVIDRASASLVADAATRFRVELEHVRESAVATDAGVAYPGILALASPVRSPRGGVLGSLSLAAPAGTLDLDRVGPLVRTAGRDLSRALAAA